MHLPDSLKRCWYRQWWFIITLAMLVPALAVAMAGLLLAEMIERNWNAYLAGKHVEGKPLTFNEARQMHLRDWIAARNAAGLGRASVRLARYGESVAGLKLEDGVLVETDATYSRNWSSDMLAMRLDHAERKKGFPQNYYSELRTPEGFSLLLSRQGEAMHSAPLSKWPATVRGCYGLRAAFLWRTLLYIETPDLTDSEARLLPPADPQGFYPRALDFIAARQASHTVALLNFSLAAILTAQPDIAVDAWVDCQRATIHHGYRGLEMYNNNHAHSVLIVLVRSGLLTEEHYRRMLAAPRFTADDFRDNLVKMHEEEMLSDFAGVAKLTEPEFDKLYDEEKAREGSETSSLLRKLKCTLMPLLPRKARKDDALQLFRTRDLCEAALNVQRGTQSWTFPKELLDRETVPQNYNQPARTITELALRQNLQRAILCYGLYRAEHNGARPVENLSIFLKPEVERTLIQVHGIGFFLDFGKANGTERDLISIETDPDAIMVADDRYVIGTEDDAVITFPPQ